jgi:L-alanine-DL-glutamate epimerase-like enolase superfamily enzyme
LRSCINYGVREHKPGIKAWGQDLALAEPFQIATKRWDSAANVFVRVELSEAWGVGEVSPDSRWGDARDSVVKEIGAADLTGLGSAYDLEAIGELLPPGPARCALDMALHDLAARSAGLTVAALLGLDRRSLPVTSVTVPIADVDRMVARAARLAGHPVLKMKVGFDGDVEAVRSVRTVYEGLIRIDANEGWSAGDAVARLRAMEPLGIELCEQPIPRNHHRELARVTESTEIPVFADEDVETAADVARLTGVVDGVNLKLRKTGGIREALRAIATARACGLGVMLGCDLTSGVAATAEASIAALVDYADIDGPLLLASDPYPGVVFSAGRMTLPAGPGLGVEVPPNRGDST